MTTTQTPSQTPDELLPLLQRRGPDWQYAGHVAVDSATLLLIDPHYDRPSQEALDAAQSRGPFGSVPLSEHPIHTAVVTHTGIGDGLYPVFVRMAPSPLGRGQTVAEVRVVFIAEED
jgi:hypothetical protein